VAAAAQDPAHPVMGMVDSPTVKVLRASTCASSRTMQLMNQASAWRAGIVTCRATSRAMTTRKASARKMLEMVADQLQFFPDCRRKHRASARDLLHLSRF
jgi:hypothetical protein